MPSRYLISTIVPHALARIHVLTAARGLIEDLEAALGEIYGGMHQLRIRIEHDLVLHVEALHLGLLVAEDDIVVVGARFGGGCDGGFRGHGGWVYIDRWTITTM
jgi:hypothetical protein